MRQGAHIVHCATLSIFGCRVRDAQQESSRIGPAACTPASGGAPFTGELSPAGDNACPSTFSLSARFRMRRRRWPWAWPWLCVTASENVEARFSVAFSPTCSPPSSAGLPEAAFDVLSGSVASYK